MRKILLLVLFSFLATGLFAQSARKEYNAKNYPSAVKICEDEIKNKKATANTYKVLLWSLIKQRNYKYARDKGIEGLRRFDDLDIKESLGVAYYYLGDYSKAMENLKAYKTEMPDGEYLDDVCYFMGEIYLRNGEYNNADISMSEAVFRYPKSAKWWSRLGYAREKAGLKDLAKAAYEKALERDKNYPDAISGLKRVKG